MTIKWVEVTVRLVSEDYKEDVGVYSQRINYEYFQHAKPNMVAEIVAVVNDFQIPQAKMPFATTDQLFGYAGQPPDRAATVEEIDAEFDKEYSLHKDRVDNS